MGYYAIQSDTGETVVQVTGRDEWALRELMRSGDKGCTPIDNPAPRWSAYIFNLRQLPIFIETIHETHQGRFPGTHARYVLRSVVLEVDTLDGL